MSHAIQPRANGIRFGIGSVMCTTASIAILLTYVKLFEPNEFLMGLTTVLFVSLMGVALGAFFHRTADAAFWSVMGAMTAFLCAVGEPLTHESFQYAWPMVGALAAATTILLDRFPLTLRMVVGACIGCVVLGLFSLLPSPLAASSAWIEVACGPIAGVIMVGVVWILETVRVWRNYSRSMMVLALAIGVIGGNVFGRWVNWL